MRWTNHLIRHIPPGQLGRYLLIGGWNTVFGYATYSALTALLTPRVRYAYVVASILGSLLNITVAFLGYKWFVFKTQGNYFREWIRCVAVYSGGIVVGTAALPFVVMFIRRASRFDAGAPYIAGAILMGLATIYNFIGHKNFSFRHPRIN
jgi:putative flippase GtrA